MAEGLIQPNYDLAREAAFYGAGGKQPGQYDTDKINAAAQTAGQIPGAYNDVIKEVLANKKAKLGQNTISQNFGSAGVPPLFKPYANVPTDTAKELAQTEGFMAAAGLNRAKAADEVAGSGKISINMLPLGIQQKALAAGYQLTDKVLPAVANSLEKNDMDAARLLDLKDKIETRLQMMDLKQKMMDQSKQTAANQVQTRKDAIMQSRNNAFAKSKSDHPILNIFGLVKEPEIASAEETGALGAPANNDPLGIR